MACSPGEKNCPRCNTLVIAATGNPDALLPPIVGGTLGRDISDLIYERLAALPAHAPPADSSVYSPGLADRWDRIDSLTIRFHLRPGASWHDGRPVTADDVAFSFAAYADSTLEAANREVIARIKATAPDDSTVLLAFPDPDPEQWYTATWSVRVLPRHIWDSIPRAAWASDSSAERLVGSGPYKLVDWNKGQSLTLERVGESASIERVVWRFAGDPDAALNLLLSHETDLVESVGDSARVARVRSDTAFTTISYPAAVYGFLGFNLNAPAGSAVRSREVRQALALGVDRVSAARAVFGPEAIAPPGPMSRILWIYDSTASGTPHDPAAAGRLLGGRKLKVDILVPGTSVTRRNLAQVIQEMWRGIGVTATVTAVDFPVFQERLRTGKFETFIGAWLDEPSPRGLEDQWTSGGIGKLNYTRYRNPVFDSLFRRAAWGSGGVSEARAAWREALDTLNADFPAIWLYNPTQVAAVPRRLEGVTIDPYSWLAGLPSWKLRNP
jgi:peptide/nickel transport system substrate-binding protein